MSRTQFAPRPISLRLKASFAASCAGMLTTALFFAAAALLPSSTLAPAFVASLVASLTGSLFGLLFSLPAKGIRLGPGNIAAMAVAVWSSGSFLIGAALTVR